MASIGLEIKEKIDSYVKAIDEGEYNLDVIDNFVENELNTNLKINIDAKSARKILHRPFRDVV